MVDDELKKGLREHQNGHLDHKMEVHFGEQLDQKEVMHDQNKEQIKIQNTEMSIMSKLKGHHSQQLFFVVHHF